MAGPFAAALELGEYVGYSIDNAARAQVFLGAASAMIRSFCDQTLSAVVDDVITVYPSASTFLRLPERPVTAVFEVEVDGVVTTDYYVVPRGLRSGSVASPGSAWTKGATVTYSHGYAATTPEFVAIKMI